MRKLACAALGFSAAVTLAHYLLPDNRLIVAAAIAFIMAFVGFLFHGNIRRRILIIALSLAAGFVWSFVYGAVFVKPYWTLHEQSEAMDAVVVDYPVAREPRGYRVDVKLKLPGKPAAGARLYYYGEQEMKPGDTVRVTATFWRTDITDDGERYDTFSSRGIFLSGSVSGDIEAISSDEGIRYLPKQIAQGVASIVDEIFPADVSHFLKALLVGRRDDLYKDAGLHAALSGAGIIHIVAISGMHISFLMGFLAVLIRNKRLFAIYGIPVLIIFMAMTGFTPAVTRAGIMQVFLICAPIFKRESDNITSLSAAMLVLLAVNPYACASVGLQLSFAATLGIILITSRMNYAIADFLRGKRISKKKIPKAIINYTTSSLATTAGALVLTLPLTVVHFGYVSLIAPITNLLTIGVVSLVFPAGLVVVIFGAIAPAAGAVAAFPVQWAVRYIAFVAHLLASVPYSIVYSSSTHIMAWFAYVYAMFTALPLFKTRVRQYLYPICISVIMLFAVIFVSLIVPNGKAGNSVTVLDIGQGLSVAATIDGRTIVVDCGSISTNKAGEITHEYLMDIGCTLIDLLAITHFHDDHVNGVEFLLSRMNVAALAIPDPDGSYIAEDIIELARRGGTDIIYVTEALTMDIGENRIFLYPPLGSGDENERGLTVLLTGSITALITGDMNSTIERALLRYADLPEIDMLVVGHHGSRHSTSEELLDALSPNIAVISVGKNSFGHPHPDTLGRLELAGAEVYRTDELGHVTIVN